MAVTAYLYPHVVEQAFGKEHSFKSGGDNYYCALVGTGYTAVLSDADNYWNDVSAYEIATGNGYTQNGVLLTNKATTYVEDTAATAWAVATPYSVGDIRRPTAANGHVYVCIVPGTSHASTEPTWSIISREVVNDNGVHWAEAGRAYTWFDCENPLWTAGASPGIAGVRYGVIHNRTPGTDATRGLFAIIDLGATESAVGGAFELQFSGLGLSRGFTAWPF